MSNEKRRPSAYDILRRIANLNLAKEEHVLWLLSLVPEKYIPFETMTMLLDSDEPSDAHHSACDAVIYLAALGDMIQLGSDKQHPMTRISSEVAKLVHDVFGPPPMAFQRYLIAKEAANYLSWTDPYVQMIDASISEQSAQTWIRSSLSHTWESGYAHFTRLISWTTLHDIEVDEYQYLIYLRRANGGAFALTDLNFDKILVLVDSHDSPRTIDPREPQPWKECAILRLITPKGYGIRPEDENGWLLSHCGMSDEKPIDIALPSDVGGCPITRIAPLTFAQLPVRRFICPEHLIEIGKEAFSGCALLENIVFSDTIACISQGAFDGCKRLQKAILPKELRSLEEFTFDGCEALESVVVPAETSSMFSYAFRDCPSLTDLVIDVKNPMFYMQDDVVFSRDNELIYCPVWKEGVYRIPDGIESIKRNAFAYSRLDQVVFPQSLTRIRSSAFFRSNLRTLNLNGVRSIEAHAFSECNRLESVIIPRSVERLGHAAFCDCKALKSAKVFANVHTIPTSLFQGSPLRFAYISPGAKKIDYFTFRNLNGKIVIPDSIDEISDAIDYRATIYAPAGSYAEQYALEKGIKFVPTSDGVKVDEI